MHLVPLLLFLMSFLLLLLSDIPQEPDVVQVALIVSLLVLILIRDPVVAIENKLEDNLALHVLVLMVLDKCEALEIDLDVGLESVQDIVLVQITSPLPLVKVARDLDRGREVVSVGRVRERKQHGCVSG